MHFSVWQVLGGWGRGASGVWYPQRTLPRSLLLFAVALPGNCYFCCASVEIVLCIAAAVSAAGAFFSIIANGSQLLGAIVLLHDGHSGYATCNVRQLNQACGNINISKIAAKSRTVSCCLSNHDANYSCKCQRACVCVCVLGHAICHNHI